MRRAFNSYSSFIFRRKGNLNLHGFADASITTGVISILVFQKRFFKQQNNKEKHPVVETDALVNDESQVS